MTCDLLDRSMAATLRFDEPTATMLALTGGKGANLSLLTQRGFPVPPGFIVTARCYREFIAGAGDLGARSAALPFGDAGALRTACDALRTELARLPLPIGLDADVRARLAAWPDTQAVSVRSS